MVVEFTQPPLANILAVHVCIPIPKSKSNQRGMRIKPLSKGPMSPGLIVVKKLRTIA